MWRKEDQRIFSFIPIHAQNMQTIEELLHDSTSIYFYLKGYFSLPLDIRALSIFTEKMYPKKKIK